MQALDSAALQKETAEDLVLAKVLRFTREGWPHKTDDVKLEKFQKLAESLTSLHGCLLYGTRVVIPLWSIYSTAYSKYPCIHPTQSISAKAAIDLLEQDFSHFGYPHTVVTDSAPCFTSDEFDEYCKERSIIHLTGTPYY